ncbi:serine/threonine protein kinase [Gimesia aquarii]|uniref:non-specific serine/threonine protein kinase n=1 Tax=Gimesia aquarii TaxID=2527964 RepID=A0A517WT58_9PLAN|nr:serine/threonine-protein kinase [Gimesia aquarii]QDU08442.1 Serine/threonine-protein kinase PrkC [Gimesia aquarii]
MSSSETSPQKGAASSNKITHLGEFRLKRKLGAGGMGDVYLAEQESLDRKVAIKTLKKKIANDPKFVERFYREAKAMAKLDHPNVVRCYAVGEDHGFHYVAIEYIDGKSMQDWMNQLKRLSVGDATLIILACLDALSHAHESKLIHRDIKPDNILVTSKGVVKVADLGLAKAVDEDNSMTQSGTGLGTPLYMPPEQARNAKHVDHRTDIYALGGTFYNFLTGKFPFSGDTALELIMNKESGKFESVRKLNPEVPEKLDLLIEKMMAKNPDHRFKSCSEIMALLEEMQLESPALSFISSAERSNVSRGRSKGKNATSSSPPPQRSTGHEISSAKDAERSTRKNKDVVEKRVWFIQHENAAGKTMVSKMTVAQIKQGVRAGVINTGAKVKRTAEGKFISLAQCPEFDSVMQVRTIKDKADARAMNMEDKIKEISRDYDHRNRRRFFKNLAEGTWGWITLIIYLGVIAGICYLGYLFIPELWRWIAVKLNLS